MYRKAVAVAAAAMLAASMTAPALAKSGHGHGSHGPRGGNGGMRFHVAPHMGGHTHQFRRHGHRRGVPWFIGCPPWAVYWQNGYRFCWLDD